MFDVHYVFLLLIVIVLLHLPRVVMPLYLYILGERWTIASLKANDRIIYEMATKEWTKVMSYTLKKREGNKHKVEQSGRKGEEVRKKEEEKHIY